jgi:hypothetical protein
VASISQFGRSDAGKEKRSAGWEGDGVLFKHTLETGSTATSRPRTPTTTTMEAAPWRPLLPQKDIDKKATRRKN